MDKLSAALTAMTNATRTHKKTLLINSVTPTLIAFLKVMQSHGYIERFTVISANSSNSSASSTCASSSSPKLYIILNGRLSKATAIVPRFNMKFNNNDLEKLREGVLPARQFGKLVISTEKGMMDHEKAFKEKLGGKVIGYFY